jgi:hypothetical protein
LFVVGRVSFNGIVTIWCSSTEDADEVVELLPVVVEAETRLNNSGSISLVGNAFPFGTKLGIGLNQKLN